MAARKGRMAVRGRLRVLCRERGRRWTRAALVVGERCGRAGGVDASGWTLIWSAIGAIAGAAGVAWSVLKDLLGARRRALAVLAVVAKLSSAAVSLLWRKLSGKFHSRGFPAAPAELFPSPPLPKPVSIPTTDPPAPPAESVPFYDPKISRRFTTSQRLAFEPGRPFVPRTGAKGDLAEFVSNELRQWNPVGIVGKAGVGKTRLAEEAFDRTLPHFPGGGFWMSGDRAITVTLEALLSGLASPRLLDCRQEAQGLEQEHIVLRHLQARPKTLVAMDNLETFNSEALGFLRALPQTCTLLTTTRVESQLENLALPVPLDEMRRDEARRFLEQETLRRGVSVSEKQYENILDVSERRPWVIERFAAAARGGRLPEALEGVRNGKETDVGDRMLTWSFDRLGLDAQKALCALSLFSPSAHNEALRAVTRLARVDLALQDLFDWQLANLDRESDPQKWSVDSLTRSYALQRTETAAFRRPFALYFHDQLRIVSGSRGIRERYEYLDEQRDNCRLALDWAIRQKSTQFGGLDQDTAGVIVDMFCDMRAFLTDRGDPRNQVLAYGEEGVTAARLLLDKSSSRRDKIRLARVTHQLALAYDFEYNKVELLEKESMKLNEELQYRPGVAISLQQLGKVEQHLGHYPEAEGYYKAALSIKRGQNDLREVAFTLHQLGILADNRGKAAEAEEYYRESLSLKRKVDTSDEQTIASTLHALAVCIRDQGRIEEADSLFRESLAIKEKVKDRKGKGWTLVELGRFEHEARQNSQVAHQYYEEGLDIAREYADKYLEARALRYLGKLATAERRYDDADECFRNASNLVRLFGEQQDLAPILWAWGLLREAESREPEAVNLLGEALEISRRMGHINAEQITKDIQRLQSKLSGAPPPGGPAIPA